MNFGGFLDASPGSAGGGQGRIIADLPYLNHLRNIGNGKDDGYNMPSPDGATFALELHHPLTKSMFSSPGLSLALQTDAGAENHCDVNNIIGGGVIGGGENSYEGITANRRSREDLEEHESRSGSDNLEAVASGDDQDAADNVNRPPRKKRYHRHTPQQIQELEALFKECPHPDERQRLELSRRLCLEMRQVKFWFQNRRTQMKTQLERHENSLLRQENDKLRVENMSLRDVTRNPICTSCGGPAIIGEISLDEQHLRIENMRLKDELDRVCALMGKFLGRPVSSLANSLVPPMLNSSLELGVGVGGGNNGFGVVYPPDFGISPNHNVGGYQQPRPLIVDRSLERSMLLELALAAMDELLKMAQTDEPLWIRGVEGGREVLNEEEYMRVFAPPCIGMRPNDFVSEASRESGMVIIHSSALVETLMDSNRWTEMFPCLIARTSITDVISRGMGGTRNGALQLMQAEMQVLSPLVPVREANFLRFSKQHAEGVWTVVDVSVDVIRETPSSSFMSCRRLPSGCVVQDMPNGYSKVTWVEHADYDESLIHPLYRPLISSGMGFGAHRWVATLQRQCQCLAIFMSSTDPTRDHTAVITLGGRRSMLKLAQRMMANFCAGVCASTVHKWNKLSVGNVDEDVKVMTRESVNEPGEPPGIVLSASTSVSLGLSPQQLFDFLRDEQLRSEWDILSNGGPMHEMTHIAKGQDHGNCVSLLRSSAMNTNQNSMLILQETCIDESGSLVVYAPVDVPAMHVVMNGGDSDYVALLPSGFVIVPDVPGNRNGSGRKGSGSGSGSQQKVSGSLLTVAFQILVNNLPTSKITVESVETVNHLISCTIQKIKAALQFEG